MRKKVERFKFIFGIFLIVVSYLAYSIFESHTAEEELSLFRVLFLFAALGAIFSAHKKYAEMKEELEMRKD